MRKQKIGVEILYVRENITFSPISRIICNGMTIVNRVILMTCFVLWKYIIKYERQEIIFLIYYGLVNEGFLVYFVTLF